MNDLVEVARSLSRQTGKSVILWIGDGLLPANAIEALRDRGEIATCHPADIRDEDAVTATVTKSRCALAIALVLALTAHASAAEVTMGGGYEQVIHSWGSDGPYPVPGTIDFEVRTWPADTLITEFQIPGIVLSNDPQFWTVDATNAASFGFDWNAAKTAIDATIADPESIIIRARLNAASARILPTTTGNVHTHIAAFELDRIELEVTHWFQTPVNGADRFIWRLIGDGIIAPEPTATALALCMFCLCRPRFRCR